MSISEEITRLIEESRTLERSGDIAAAIQRAQRARHRGTPVFVQLYLPMLVR